MRWALICVVVALGAGAYALTLAHQARELRAAEARWREQVHAAAVRASDRAMGRLSPEQEAEEICTARAEMAAAVHGSDAARVRAACMAGWRTTGAFPRP